MKLNLDLLLSYGFESRTFKPDWDDTAIEFTLPNGISLIGLTQCNNSPTECDALEGIDGYIYVETKEELDDLLSKTCEEVFLDIKNKNPKFNIDEYL